MPYAHAFFRRCPQPPTPRRTRDLFEMGFIVHLRREPKNGKCELPKSWPAALHDQGEPHIWDTNKHK